jgi:hypothetical protein
MATATKAKQGRDLDAFRAQHDKAYIIPKKIREGLTSLGDSWEYESEFQRRIMVSNTDFGRYREQFVDFFIEVGGKNPKRVWAGTKAYATKLREVLN